MNLSMHPNHIQFTRAENHTTQKIKLLQELSTNSSIPIQVENKTT